MSEIRYDPLFDEYVIIAPERLHRPMELRCEPTNERRRCPFCPGNEDLTPPEIYRLEKNGSWRTRVVPNLYKALQIETPFVYRQDEGEAWGGFGAHEIIVDTPRHVSDLQLNQEELFYWLLTIKERIEDLRKDRRLVMANVFKNHGPSAGATQSHPHTQIIATPLMSRSQKRLFDRTFWHYKEHGVTLFERIHTPYILKESSRFKLFCPFASFFPFESTILSSTHSLVALDEEGMQDLAKLMSSLFTAMHKELADVGFNLLFYLPPLNQNFENEEYFHEIERFFRFFIRITPRIYTLGGFEISSQCAINPLDPKEAAKLLGRHL